MNLKKNGARQLLYRFSRTASTVSTKFPKLFQWPQPKVNYCHIMRSIKLKIMPNLEIIPDNMLVFVVCNIHIPILQEPMVTIETRLLVK